MNRAVLIRDGAVVLDRVELALGMVSRMVGLLGRVGIPDRTGMLLAPCSSIHMAFMRFPIDLAGLGLPDGISAWAAGQALRHGDPLPCVVREVVAGIAPWRLHFCGRTVWSVLEAGSGQLAGVLHPGDAVIIKPVSVMRQG